MPNRDKPHLAGNTCRDDYDIGILQGFLETAVIFGVTSDCRRSRDVANVDCNAFDDRNNIKESQVGNDVGLLQQESKRLSYAWQ